MSKVHSTLYFGKKGESYEPTQNLVFDSCNVAPCIL